MRTLQVLAPRSEFTIHELPVPVPAPDEVLVRIEGVATCPQWDLHLRHNEPMFIGHRFVYPYGHGQPGHEAAGTVEAVGEAVTTLSLGDRVAAWRDPGPHVPGCYAEYVCRPAEHLIRVPAHLPIDDVASVELAMCVAASVLRLRNMRLLGARRAGVSGLGPAGLIAAQLLRAEGAGEIVGFDTVPARRDFALHRGLVDAAHDPRDCPLPVRPHAAPALDIAIDCVGAATSVHFLLDRTAEIVALFGVQREAYAFEVHHYPLILCGYPGHSRAAAEYAVGKIASGVLRLGLLITHRLPLSRYADGIALLERQEALKILFDPRA